MKHNFLKKLMALLLGTIMVFSMIPAIAVGTKAAEVESVTFSFTSLTGKGSTKLDSKSDLTSYLNKCGPASSTYITKATATNVYDGNGSGGWKPSTAGLLKFGASGKDGILNLTFSSNVNKVEIVCHAWKNGDKDTVKVNDAAAVQASSIDAWGTVAFDITPNKDITITTNDRVFVQSITVYFDNAGSGAACEHANKVAIGEAKEANCTEDGITAGEMCSDCGKVLVEQETIESTGHDYVGKICSVCGAEKPAIPTFKKVTSTLADFSGTYLIVYETGKVAFNGALTTLDAVSNTVGVTISDGVITGDNLAGSVFYIKKTSNGKYTIQSDSGVYVGRTANSNGMNTNTTESYAHTIEIDAGNAVITTDNGYILRYNNTSGQNRFRYYKSGQQAITLYKLVHEPEYKGFGLTLNKGVTVRVKFNVTAEWLEANPNAMVTFSNGDSFPAEAGEKYYYTTLTPGQIGSGLTVTLGDITKNVSVNDYIAAATANNPNAALVNLLNSIVTYGKATAGEAGVITETFEGVSDVTLADELGVFGEVSAVLGTTANLSIALNNTENLTFTATLGEISISGNVAAEAKDGALIIENLCPLHYNDEIVVTITDTETSETSTLRFTFNAYLAKLYDACENDAQRALVAAAYQYGVAAEAYQNPQ